MMPFDRSHQGDHFCLWGQVSSFSSNKDTTLGCFSMGCHKPKFYRTFTTNAPIVQWSKQLTLHPNGQRFESCPCLQLFPIFILNDFSMGNSLEISLKMPTWDKKSTWRFLTLEFLDFRLESALIGEFSEISLETHKIGPPNHNQESSEGWEGKSIKRDRIPL